MLALLDAFPERVALVASNEPTAAALSLAGARGVAKVAVDHRDFGRDRAAHEEALAALLDEAACELVCLAGYMRVLTPFFVSRYAGRLLNIHPSLLPAFPGLHTHARAIKAGVTLHGCTVHEVTDTVDAGPIVAQAAVPVLPHDTPAALAARVLVQENLLYPAAVAAFLHGNVARPGTAAALSNPLPLPARPA